MQLDVKRKYTKKRVACGPTITYVPPRFAHLLLLRGLHELHGARNRESAVVIEY
jgi:hypothetical protein